ncbi:MAG TPA: hypothetical protein VMV51_03175 [Gemmatimonadaceae bacterium]|nr:hypothetical protein [Gemmatimonadaceae bacterium]
MADASARRTVTDENGDEHTLIFGFVKHEEPTRGPAHHGWKPEGGIVTEAGLPARWDKDRAVYWITLPSGEEVSAKGDPPPKKPEDLP